MKAKLIALAIVGGLTLPVAAQAHTTRAELRRDHAAVQHEKRQLHRAVANKNWHRAKVERRELARAKHELREDRRDFRRTR
ncbi:hypothetical protein [Novosphingobium sp. B 225]|uniref:hypothetical protein n=1 Tax=Novosphingobium sp. B 225 TaxID=1961849 RepID=UPI000B4B7831|nr:hypothetical protein [Novosphingobium sp. B 225]